MYIFSALRAPFTIGFFRWGGGDIKEYIGLENFRKVLHDRVFWSSFIVIAILMVSNVVKLVPSILVAVLIHRLKSDKWQYWYRIGVVLPMIIPGLVTLFIWKFFFDPTQGALNYFLDASHIQGPPHKVYDHGIFHWGVFHQGIPISWLGEPSLIIPSLIIWGFPWIGTVGVLIYLAGLQSIGTEVYEAADLDGASSWRKFVHIEFPLIMTQVRLSLVMLIIGTLQGYGNGAVPAI